MVVMYGVTPKASVETRTAVVYELRRKAIQVGRGPCDQGQMYVESALHKDRF